MESPYKTERDARHTMCPLRSTENATHDCMGGGCALWIWREPQTITAWRSRRLVRPGGPVIQGSEFGSTFVDQPGWKCVEGWFPDDEDPTIERSKYERENPDRRGACAHVVNAFANATRPSGVI